MLCLMFQFFSFSSHRERKFHLPILSEQLTHCEEEETIHSCPLRAYSIPHRMGKTRLTFCIWFRSTILYTVAALHTGCKFINVEQILSLTWRTVSQQWELATVESVYVRSRLRDYLACILQKLFGLLSCCSGQELSIWQPCTAFMPFRLLINHSASFQAVWPAFKLFDLVSKWDNFALLKAGQPA